MTTLRKTAEVTTKTAVMVIKIVKAKSTKVMTIRREKAMIQRMVRAMSQKVINLPTIAQVMAKMV